MIQGTRNSNVTWDKVDGEYVVVGNITLNSGNTLTIDPGVIVKFAGNHTFNVGGNLQALGTSGDKIIFTSINDRTVGGNTGTGTPNK